jgi:general secretion pathway protein E
VRFRVDGTLREVVQPNKALHAALISRLKIMAELDIAEKRLPQDGRISCASAAAPSTCACRRCPGHGERAVLRLLDKTESKFTLEGLGMSGDVLTPSTAWCSSRTASCWSPAPPARARPPRCTPALGRLDTATTNMLTVEDPIEYELPASARPRSTRRST